MKKITYRLSLFIIGIVTLYTPFKMEAQGFLKTNNQQIVDGNNQEVILRGMGLGGWMLQEGYMMQTQDVANTQHELKEKIADLIGQNGMETFYDAWLKNHGQEVDIDSLASWGFNSVRLPMHYNLFTLPVESEPVTGKNTWLQKGFDLTDSLLKWCAKYQIYLILDLHAAPGGQGKDQAISDYDPSKPSLWENIENRKKTVALWKKLAERYVNEQWIGGYDLINETNWDMNGNAPLITLYKEITDSIRKVDQNHIIFIEGNWFANDFSGLTPPWDNNMVYSFHKYWTYNTQSVIQWMLDIRNIYNVPVWLGESGENSNTWFKECIKLLEDNKIGWAWWPMKKIGSIAGPLSVIKTDEYEILLKYWKGEVSKPTADFAAPALMKIADNLKMKNCEYHPDVIDAMFRQIKSIETKPYKKLNIPGVIFASDFDMGQNGFAYSDIDVANYHLSTNTYAAWNQGWEYRNDGVDIQQCKDLVFSNKYNVGYTADGEWMQYTVDIAKTALYNVNIRTASENSSGVFHFQEDGADISPSVAVISTGGWQIWQTTKVNNLVLTKGTHKLRFYMDKGGFNLSSFEFTEVGETSDILTEYISAKTGTDEYTIHISMNKAMPSNLSPDLSDFKVSIDGSDVSITDVNLNASNPRILDIKISNLMKFGNNILLSYSGTQIKSVDGIVLEKFTDKVVLNNLPPRYDVPVKIQAEEYYQNNGLSPETCTDNGGGIDLGWTDKGDYLDYLINVNSPGVYAVNYRIASESAAGQIEMQLVGESVTTLHQIDLPITGGWQTWTTATLNAELPAGQHLLRLMIKKPGFNINWIQFDFVSGIHSPKYINQDLQIYPNPAKGNVFIRLETNQLISVQIYNMSGQIQLTGSYKKNSSSENKIDISGLKNGTYLLKISTDKGIVNYRLVVEN